MTFVNFNVDDNSTSQNVAKAYGVTATPTTVVLRKDGSAAIFVGPLDSSSVNTVKSAIDDARGTY